MPLAFCSAVWHSWFLLDLPCFRNTYIAIPNLCSSQNTPPSTLHFKYSRFIHHIHFIGILVGSLASRLFGPSVRLDGEKTGKVFPFLMLLLLVSYMPKGTLKFSLFAKFSTGRKMFISFVYVDIMILRWVHVFRKKPKDFFFDKKLPRHAVRKCITHSVRKYIVTPEIVNKTKCYTIHATIEF